MQSNTLYLKYRPQSLEEIVGQEELVKVLQNSAKTGNVAHAYLFSGGRGTGKTTTARAFAKELGIHKEDILELDAASNNGVQEIKDLGESVHTLPYFSKYKMYILDEAHMLTKAASNAFLKTLEEPPKHVIFVLCTTDPEKMLETILSRCTKFNLKSPNQDTLTKFLAGVCEKEGVKVGKKISKEAVNLVALSGDGSYRDSLSNLQKVFAFENEEYSEEFVSKILGVPQTSSIFEYLKSLDGIVGQDVGIKILQDLEKLSVDPKLFAKELTYFARLVLLARHKLIGEKEIQASYGEHVLEFMMEFLKNNKKDTLPKINSAMLAKIIEAENISKNSSLPFLVYELLLLI